MMLIIKLSIKRTVVDQQTTAECCALNPAQLENTPK